MLLNARRSGRFHCRFTGPYYLLMIAPTLALGSMDAPLHAWLVLAALVLLGDKIILVGDGTRLGNVFFTQHAARLSG